MSSYSFGISFKIDKKVINFFLDQFLKSGLMGLYELYGMHYVCIPSPSCNPKLFSCTDASKSFIQILSTMLTLHDCYLFLCSRVLAVYSIMGVAETQFSISIIIIFLLQILCTRAMILYDIKDIIFSLVIWVTTVFFSVFFSVVEKPLLSEKPNPIECRMKKHIGERQGNHLIATT